jgi:predicted transcriptional regulator
VKEIRFDPSKPHLKKMLKPYEELTLRYFWNEGNEEAKTRDILDYVNEELGEGKSISRASIISFLSKMVEEGVLGTRQSSGKGGLHPIYRPRMSEIGYIKHVLRTIIDSLHRDYPLAVKEVINEFAREWL